MNCPHCSGEMDDYGCTNFVCSMEGQAEREIARLREELVSSRNEVAEFRASFRQETERKNSAIKQVRELTALLREAQKMIQSMIENDDAACAYPEREAVMQRIKDALKEKE